MLSQSQLRALSVLAEVDNSGLILRELSQELDWSEGHASRVVNELATAGYVQTTGARAKVIRLAEGDAVSQLAELFAEYSHMDLPELLAGSGLVLLYYLDEKRTGTELAARSGLGRSTVYRRLDELQRVGIVGKDNSQFHLTPSFRSLSFLTRGLARRAHRHEASTYTTEIRLIWERHDEYLLECGDEVSQPNFHPTGLTQYRKFGLDLLTRDKRQYLRAERSESVSAAELVCHTLLLSETTRYRTYALLLMQKESLSRADVAPYIEHYGPTANSNLEHVVEELFLYLEEQGDIESAMLPEWSDFSQTAAQYEVAL